MNESARAALADVLQKARTLLELPDNDFNWSSWEDQEHALQEMNDVIQRVQTDDMPPALDLEVLFAPTGPLQEVSLSSGWGAEFLAVAREFDAAMEPFKAPPATEIPGS